MRILRFRNICKVSIKEKSGHHLSEEDGEGASVKVNCQRTFVRGPPFFSFAPRRKKVGMGDKDLKLQFGKEVFVSGMFFL